MADQISLTTIGAVVLTEGIKFLCGQAGDVLKRRRERSNEPGGLAQSEAISIPPAPSLEGQLVPVVVPLDRVAALAEQLHELRRSLADYADGIEDVDPGDRELLVRVDALRRLLEVVYGQRITFRGESRPPSGTPIVVGVADVREVAGYAAAVRAKHVVSGEIRGGLKVTRVEQGGRAIGVDIDKIGEKS